MTGPFREAWTAVRRQGLVLWFAFSLIIQLSFPLPVGTNPASRWATLAAMAEEGSFRINSYVASTIDWAQTPDGSFYSNKAPGPMLLGYPVFKVLDWVQVGRIPDRSSRDRTRLLWQGFNLRVLSFLFQIVPFFLLAMFWVRRLEIWKCSRPAIARTMAALLMGNTAIVFLNSYFGHGLAAVCALAMLFAVTGGAWVWTGFFFGLGVLCDYGSALFLLPLLIASRLKVAPLRALVLGGLVPGVLWIGYHTACFTSPFTIATRFQNPAFVDKADQAWNLWGVLSFPDPRIVFELLFGSARGLLATQPWALIVLAVGAAALYRKRVLKPQVLVFLIASVLLLLLMNASFGGWHGGNTPGPRYLSAAVAMLAIGVGLVWDGLHARNKALLTAAIVFSVFAHLVFLSVYLDMPHPFEPLWTFYYREFTGTHAATPIVRLTFGLPIAGYLLFRAFRPRP